MFGWFKPIDNIWLRKFMNFADMLKVLLKYPTRTLKTPLLCKDHAIQFYQAIY